MTFTQAPGWTYATSMAVYFTKHPEARLSSEQVCELLQLGTATTAHINMRGALLAGIVAKQTEVIPKVGKRTKWVMGPVLARRLAS